MAHKKKREEEELPFVALMDTMTNVVGVLVIVLVLVGLGMSSAVKKILSDLPSVDVATFEQAKKDMAQNSVVDDPKKLDEQQKKMEEDIKRSSEELKTLDLTAAAQNAKFTDLDEIRKQIDQRTKERDAGKAEADKLIAQLDEAKKLLDTTPSYVAPQSTIVRLPNPRAYPAQPKEMRVMVALPGVVMFDEAEFMQPLISGLEKLKGQMQYKEALYPPFQKMVDAILTAPVAQQAWPEIGPLMNTAQVDQLAQAYLALHKAGTPPNRGYLQALLDVGLTLGATLPQMAEAAAAAGAGNFAPWLALDPGNRRTPAVPVMKAQGGAREWSFAYGAFTVQTKTGPAGFADWIKQLSEFGAFKDRSKTVVIYDSAKLRQALERAFGNPTFNRGFTVEITQNPAAAYLTLTLKPTGGAGEATTALGNPSSNYQRVLRAVKADPNGVAVFQVQPDAFTTYLTAREIADSIGVAATWDFLPKLEVVQRLLTFPVQRTALAAAATRPAAAAGVRITAPGKTLD
jgi:hypothetical protein